LAQLAYGDEHKGDGLTVYEEYRGFSENHTHRRTNPLHKDLFIRDQIADARSASGIMLWRQVSQLDVHFRLADDEIDTGNRLINFNLNSETPHKVDQHGLILMTQNATSAVSRAENVSGFKGNSTPGSKQGIKVLQSVAYFTTVAVGRARIQTDEFAATVAHEIAHGCSVYHHGESDESRTWTQNGYDTSNQVALYLESDALEVSQDLHNWTSLDTNLVATTATQVWSRNVSATSGFYRLRWQ
jgi:hypothetical protein